MKMQTIHTLCKKKRISKINEKLEELMNIFNEKLNLAETEAKEFEHNMKADGERIKKDIRTATN